MNASTTAFNRSKPAMSSTCFFSLPYELRQHILRLCVRQTRTIELQQPLWAGPGAFSQALFSTCRQLRDEALEAFYKTNAFVWIIEVDGRMTRTDPARYPLPRLRGRSTAICTSVLPWEYPMLLAHLRHVYLNICLSDPEKEVLWITKLQEDLTRLVFALDHSIRLRTIKLSFTSHNRNARAGLSSNKLFL